eukprot:SAG31_NODE_2083_length_6490_cov_21.969645_7_plen_126_part_00
MDTFPPAENILYDPTAIGTGEDWRPGEVIRVVEDRIYLDEDSTVAEKEKQARKRARQTEKFININDRWEHDTTGTEPPEIGAKVAVYYPTRLNGKGWESSSWAVVSPLSATYCRWLQAKRASPLF